MPGPIAPLDEVIEFFSLLGWFEQDIAEFNKNCKKNSGRAAGDRQLGGADTGKAARKLKFWIRILKIFD